MLIRQLLIGLFLMISFSGFGQTVFQFDFDSTQVFVSQNDLIEVLSAQDKHFADPATYAQDSDTIHIKEEKYFYEIENDTTEEGHQYLRSMNFESELILLLSENKCTVQYKGRTIEKYKCKIEDNKYRLVHDYFDKESKEHFLCFISFRRICGGSRWL